MLKEISISGYTPPITQEKESPKKEAPLQQPPKLADHRNKGADEKATPTRSTHEPLGSVGTRANPHEQTTIIRKNEKEDDRTHELKGFRKHDKKGVKKSDKKIKALTGK